MDIDLIGMLAGAALAGHLVAKQTVDVLSPGEPSPELAGPSSSRRASSTVAAAAAAGERLARSARCDALLGARPIGVRPGFRPLTYLIVNDF